MNKYYWGTKQYHLFQMYSSGLHLREILFLHTSTPLWKRIRFWVYYLLSAYPAFSESAADLFIPDMSRTVPFNSILMYQANRSFILPRWKHFCFCFPMTIGFYVLVWLHFTVLLGLGEAWQDEIRFVIFSTGLWESCLALHCIQNQMNIHLRFLLRNESTFLLLLQRVSHVHFCNLAFDHMSTLKNPRINQPEISNLACVNASCFIPLRDGFLPLPLLIPLSFVFINILAFGRLWLFPLTLFVSLKTHQHLKFSILKWAILFIKPCLPG